MKRPFIYILLDKIKELGENPKTLVIDGDTKSVFQEVWQYDWGGYNNIGIQNVAYTKNYAYLSQDCYNDNYQEITVIPRNPSVNAKTFDELITP